MTEKNYIDFNKDKNQVGTPIHIVDFIYELLEIREGQNVFDPTCGVGNMFKDFVNCYGVEFDSKVYRNLNKVKKGEFLNASVFDCKDCIQEKHIDYILMNPPFNLEKTAMPPEYIKRYGTKGEDITKGLYFLE